MKTIFVNERDAVRNWYIVDAAGKPLGRVAAKVASVLRGKHKVTFARNQEMGDYVVIINADKVAVTGAKVTDKLYHHHTGYVGGLKTFTFEKKIQRHPDAPLKLAIKGMLPKGPLGRQMYTKLHVYAGPEHNHAAQKPEVLTF